MPVRLEEQVTSPELHIAVAALRAGYPHEGGECARNALWQGFVRRYEDVANRGTANAAVNAVHDAEDAQALY